VATTTGSVGLPPEIETGPVERTTVQNIRPIYMLENRNKAVFTGRSQSIQTGEDPPFDRRGP
jgi:hypothetical protein